jgi:peptide deformylase
MIETMRDYDGVGLAAPQVHVSRQITVLEVEPSRGRPADAAPVPLTVLVNPRVTPLGDGAVRDWEGCLSIPDLRGLVPRAPAVRVEALDRRGRPLDFVARGFHARVVQHEHDHLRGRVYLDCMDSLDTLTHLAEWERYWLKA